MIKTLTNVGNSKAVIIPKRLIEKFKLEKVVIQETDEGILIRSAEGEEETFQEKLQQLRKNKKDVYSRMKSQAQNPDTLAYYQNSDITEIDIDITEE